MMTEENNKGLQQRLTELQTDKKHLLNELQVTKEEYEESSSKYFEIYLHLDEKVKERTAELEKLNQELRQEIQSRKKVEVERENLIKELREALATVKKLSGLLPICASCKKIRDDKGYWNQIESYLRDHSEVEFSHGICPDCAKALYPDIYLNDIKRKREDDSDTE